MCVPPCGDGAYAGCSARSWRLASQNTKPIRAKKINTVTETTCVAKPSVGVKASGVVANDAVNVPMLAKPGADVAHESHEPGKGHRDEDKHVLGACRDPSPQHLSGLRPAKRKTSITVIATMANRTEPTWGTERPS